MSQTIFVLEDDPDISRLVQHQLESAGFSVRSFSTPTNLVPDAERQAPALFLLDIMVPGGDGLDVCRRARKKGFANSILILTARDDPESTVEGLSDGADDYLGKPFDLSVLAARARVLLRRNERRPSRE